MTEVEALRIAEIVRYCNERVTHNWERERRCGNDMQLRKSLKSRQSEAAHIRDYLWWMLFKAGFGELVPNMERALW